MDYFSFEQWFDFPRRKETAIEIKKDYAKVHAKVSLHVRQIANDIARKKK
jgi:hypothetical protein